MMSRNRQDLDLIEYIRRLEARVKNLESTNRTANTSVDSGSFTLTGGRLTITDTLGNTIFELRRENDSPVMYMYPTYGNPNSDVLKVSATSTVDNGPEFRVENLMSDGTPYGGYLSVAKGGVALSQFADGGIESGVSFSPREDRQRAVVLKGRFWPNETVDGNQATFVGQLSVDSGFSSVTISYDREMTDCIMVPVVTLVSAANVAWGISSQTTTDFTVSWADTTAKVINYWCFAIPVGA